MPPRSNVGRVLLWLRGGAAPQPTGPATAPAYVAPRDPAKAMTLLTRLRDLSLDATAKQLTLNGQLETRRAAIVQAVKDDDYDGAEAALDTLNADLADEKAARDLEAQNKAKVCAVYDTSLKARALDALKPGPTTSKAVREAQEAVRLAEQAYLGQVATALAVQLEALLKTLAEALDKLELALKAQAEADRAWKALAKSYEGAVAKLAECLALKAPEHAALALRMKALDKAVTDGELQEAVDALPALRKEILAAHQQATERVSCEKAYAKLASVVQEARRVPALNKALTDLHNQRKAAWTDFYNDYVSGKYALAEPKLALVQSTSQAVINAAMDVAEEARPEINPTQLAKADTLLKGFDEKDRVALQDLIDKAPTPKHQQNLKKAIAAGHSPTEVATFCKRIQGQSEEWLQDHLHITASSTGTGVQQQWVMSCQATTAQAVKAELDPIYALSLHDAVPNLNELAEDTNTVVAVEQKQMLESAKDEVLNATYQAGVTERLKGETPKARAALQALIDNAPSNWEKNRVMEVIARPAKHTAKQVKTRYEANIKGKGGGEAVHKTVKGAPSHRGRGGVDLLNRQKAVTGLKYETQLVSSADRNAAVDDIAVNLTKGWPVPLSVGANEGELRHYVLAISVHPGPPKTFFIHDPASGTTVARTEAQVKNNQLDLPSGWTRLNKYEKPSAD
jgi:hypothetical protein